MSHSRVSVRPMSHKCGKYESEWSKCGKRKESMWIIINSTIYWFSCYKTSEKVERFFDSGCTGHITPRKSDFVEYTELGQASKSGITDRKYLTIEGYGTVIGHCIMPNWMASLQIQNMLYVPQANKWLFLLIATGQWGSVSQTMNKGTTLSKNGTSYIGSTPKSGRLHSFNMELVKNKNEIPWAIIATISDYTLWHRRMGHAHQCVINISEKTQKVVLIKPLMHLMEPVRDVKKESPRDFLSQLQNQGQNDHLIWFIPIWMKSQFSPLADTSILPPT